MEESRGKKWEGLRLCGRSNLSKQISVRHGADEDPFCQDDEKSTNDAGHICWQYGCYTVRAVINYIRTSRRVSRALLAMLSS